MGFSTVLELLTLTEMIHLQTAVAALDQQEFPASLDPKLANLE